MLREDKESFCPNKLWVVQSRLDNQTVIQLYQAGLDGLCSTAVERLSLIHTLELVMLGEVFIPGSIVVEMHNEGLPSAQVPASYRAANDVSILVHKLSHREAEILHLLTQGASNKHIAQLLGLTEQTVKAHLKAILRKVNAANRTQAAVWALEHLSIAALDQTINAAE